MAQSNEDSTSINSELTLEEPEEIDIETVIGKSDNFTNKKDRIYEWIPSPQKNIPDTIVKALKKQDAFWYADLAQESKKIQDKQKKDIPSWLGVLTWIIIIGGFLFFLVTYLASSNVGLFRKKNVSISDDETEVMPEDIFAINYQKEIDKAASAGNYRLAVRLLFLQLLKNMSERNIIKYKQDKTNFDYLSELYNSSWYKQFFKVTRNYEYTWYGQFEISEDVYKLVRTDFAQFENQLS